MKYKNTNTLYIHLGISTGHFKLYVNRFCHQMEENLTSELFTGSHFKCYQTKFKFYWCHTERGLGFWNWDFTFIAYLCEYGNSIMSMSKEWVSLQRKCILFQWKTAIKWIKHNSAVFFNLQGFLNNEPILLLNWFFKLYNLTI